MIGDKVQDGRDRQPLRYFFSGESRSSKIELVRAQLKNDLSYPNWKSFEAEIRTEEYLED